LPQLGCLRGPTEGGFPPYGTTANGGFIELSGYMRGDAGEDMCDNVLGLPGLG